RHSVHSDDNVSLGALQSNAWTCRNTYSGSDSSVSYRTWHWNCSYYLTGNVMDNADRMFSRRKAVRVSLARPCPGSRREQRCHSKEKKQWRKTKIILASSYVWRNVPAKMPTFANSIRRSLHRCVSRLTQRLKSPRRCSSFSHPSSYRLIFRRILRL